MNQHGRLSTCAMGLSPVEMADQRVTEKLETVIDIMMEDFSEWFAAAKQTFDQSGEKGAVVACYTNMSDLFTVAGEPGEPSLFHWIPRPEIPDLIPDYDPSCQFVIGATIKLSRDTRYISIFRKFRAINPRQIASPLLCEAIPTEEFLRCCAVCGANGASSKCSRCKSAWYCSRECQKEHWPTHKLVCSKAKELRTNSKLLEKEWKKKKSSSSNGEDH